LVKVSLEICLQIVHYADTFVHYADTFVHHVDTFVHHADTFVHYADTFVHYVDTFATVWSQVDKDASIADSSVRVKVQAAAVRNANTEV